MHLSENEVNDFLEVMFISPYEMACGIVWFPRMLGKIRMRSQGELPEEYHPYMGNGFDGRCARFLGVSYADIVELTLAGKSDEEVISICFDLGHQPTEEEKLVWNDFMIKRGWRDSDGGAASFQAYKERYSHGDRADILTYFDFFEIDEGRREK